MLRERGFALLDALVALAIASAFMLAASSALGLRSSRTHPAALALQAALVEARSVALATADSTDAHFPTGATVVVSPDPLRANGSIISVYRSRPIRMEPGASRFALPSDTGFAAQRVTAAFKVTPGNRPPGTPFAILLSSSGYASVAIPYTLDPRAPALLSLDPGCPDAGVTIAASDGWSVEAHPFVCRDGSYDASVRV